MFNRNLVQSSVLWNRNGFLTHVVFRLSKIINQVFQTHHHFVQIHILEEHRCSSINLQRL